MKKFFQKITWITVLILSIYILPACKETGLALNADLFIGANGNATAEEIENTSVVMMPDESGNSLADEYIELTPSLSDTNGEPLSIPVTIAKNDGNDYTTGTQSYPMTMCEPEEEGQELIVMNEDDSTEGQVVKCQNIKQLPEIFTTLDPQTPKHFILERQIYEIEQSPEIFVLAPQIYVRQIAVGHISAIDEQDDSILTVETNALGYFKLARDFLVTENPDDLVFLAIKDILTDEFIDSSNVVVIQNNLEVPKLAESYPETHAPLNNLSDEAVQISPNSTVIEINNLIDENIVAVRQDDSTLISNTQTFNVKTVNYTTTEAFDYILKNFNF